MVTMDQADCDVLSEKIQKCLMRFMVRVKGPM